MTAGPRGRRIAQTSRVWGSLPRRTLSPIGDVPQTLFAARPASGRPAGSTISRGALGRLDAAIDAQVAAAMTAPERLATDARLGDDRAA